MKLHFLFSYVFHRDKLIEESFNTVKGTATATTTPTTGSMTSSWCNYAPRHHRRLIFVPNSVFLIMLSSLKKVLILLGVHKH